MKEREYYRISDSRVARAIDMFNKGEIIPLAVFAVIKACHPYKWRHVINWAAESLEDPADAVEFTAFDGLYSESDIDSYYNTAAWKSLKQYLGIKDITEKSEYIAAINNAMSSLTVLDTIAEDHTPSECYKYVERHTKHLEDVGVSVEICAHYKAIAELILDEHFL